MSYFVCVRYKYRKHFFCRTTERSLTLLQNKYFEGTHQRRRVKIALLANNVS